MTSTLRVAAILSERGKPHLVRSIPLLRWNARFDGVSRTSFPFVRFV
jgi:hypothetical protein